MLKKYGRNILIGIDQFANILLGGSTDETISSRLGRNYDGTWMEKFVNFLFSWRQKDHCSESIEKVDTSDALIAKIKDKLNIG